LVAATPEAQEKCRAAGGRADVDYLLSGAISNAVTSRRLRAEEAPKLKPFIALAEKLGSFAGQLTRPAS